VAGGQFGEIAPTSAATPQLLFTPGQAAQLLAVSESWLRRRAGRRAIACTFLGKHLRFSVADMAAIASQGSQVVHRPRGPRVSH
jgi:hypothetical protein